MNVDRDGKFSFQGDPRILYLVMLITRTRLINLSWGVLIFANIIGIRYSIIRRQFKNISGQKTET